jgi:hypothetical protein
LSSLTILSCFSYLFTSFFFLHSFTSYVSSLPVSLCCSCSIRFSLTDGG